MNCSILPEVIFSSTERDCRIILEERVKEFLDTNGRKYINSIIGINSEDGKINCPNGVVALPIDTWHCKLDNLICGLQAYIDLSNKKNFLTNCRSPQKEEIYNSVDRRKYKGFHHVIGRYLCPSCDHILSDSQQYFKYHYPWELYPLGECINSDDRSTIINLRRNNIPISVITSKVCAPCFVRYINILLPSIAGDFFVLEIDFYPR